MLQCAIPMVIGMPYITGDTDLVEIMRPDVIEKLRLGPRVPTLTYDTEMRRDLASITEHGDAIFILRDMCVWRTQFEGDIGTLQRQCVESLTQVAIDDHVAKGVCIAELDVCLFLDYVYALDLLDAWG